MRFKSSVSLDSLIGRVNHDVVNLLKNHGALIFLVSSLLGLYLCLPLGTALELGGDEGYQLMMGFLNNKGFALYREIWSDQPPLFVLLLAWMFKAFGPSICAARFLAAGFGIVMFGCLFQMIRLRLPTQAAFIGTLLLLASPGILMLSVSVMQEVPMFALVLLSTSLLFQWQRSQDTILLVASGIVMALATEIKLLALLAVPAIGAELILDCSTNRICLRKDWLRSIALWLGATVAVLALFGLTWARGSLHTAWLAHASEQYVPGRPSSRDFPIGIDLFFNHAEVIIAAIVGIALTLWKRRWREFVFPSILLLTVTGVHALHRPWWDYYYLHFAIPLAWFGGFAMSQMLRDTQELLAKRGFQIAGSATWKALLLCGMLGLAFTLSLKRLEAGVKETLARPKLADDLIVAKMRKSADRAHWAYAEKPIYAFHAQIPMPPEIAMVTLKRFWSGQITTPEIVESCRRHNVRQLLLATHTCRDPDWARLTGQKYLVDYQDGDSTLFIAKP